MNQIIKNAWIKYEIYPHCKLLLEITDEDLPSHKEPILRERFLEIYQQIKNGTYNKNPIADSFYETYNHLLTNGTKS